MKVLLVDQLGNKGYEYVYDAARNYSKDFDVTCYMSDNTPQDVDTSGFHVLYGFHNLYCGSKFEKGIKYIRSLNEMKKVIQKEHFDIIHLQWFELPIYDFLYIRSLKKLYKPAPKIVFTVHGVLPKNQDRFSMYIHNVLCNEADAILLHTNVALGEFNSYFNVNCKKYVVTPAFRDESKYKRLNKEIARKKLGIPLDKTVILNFGTIWENKSIDILYEAFPKAFLENSNLFLLSAGTLNVRNKSKYQKLAQKNRATGAARIEFEYISKEMEPYYYSCADILVLPYSTTDPSGVAYCGLLYGLPMIATKIEQLDIMAKDGINADIFEDRNIDDLADKIVNLASSPERLKKYAIGSRDILTAEFSIQKRVAVTEQAYLDLLEEF